MHITSHALPDEVDITIIGGGPVGALMALRLIESGHNVLLIEAREEQINDPRALALSWSSVEILQKLGVWDKTLSATAMDTIHVSQQHSIGQTCLYAHESNIPHLGYVVGFSALLKNMHAQLAQSTTPCAFGIKLKRVTFESTCATLTLETLNNTEHTLRTQLVIMADGGKPIDGLLTDYHHKDYQQTAIVSHIDIETPHQHIAYERFSKDGPIALLPCQDGFALIWTQTPEKAREKLALEETAFLEALQSCFKYRAPTLKKLGPVHTFPIRMKALKPSRIERIIYIGNGAQTLHPIAGQGLNLGIRDAVTLSRLLYQTEKDELGLQAMLKNYHDRRRKDRALMLHFTDLLVESFAKSGPFLNPLRSMGLFLLNQQPALKKQFAKYMLFGF